VPWRKTPLPPYQPRSGSSTQTLLEMQLERRLDNLPEPETLTAACWQQLDSINRKDAARLLDKVANGTMVLRLGTVHALAAQNWSRPRMRQFLCWLLYIDRGLENVVTYTDAAKLCLQDLLYKMDLEEAQIYIDLSQLQQRGFQLKACTMFSGWDEGAVQLNGAAVAAFRQGMFTDRQRLRSYLRWLIGLDGAGAPYHNVRLTLTKDGAQALFRFLQERNDYDLWDLARCRLPHMDWDLTPQGSSEERPSRAPGARPSPAPGAPHRS
jgi:hypothetical protein